MNILYINHYAGSFNLGMEFRPWLLSKEWGSQGHKVRVVVSSYSHIRQVNKEEYCDFYLEKMDKNIEYQWIKTPRYKTNGIKRLINILVFVFKLFFQSKAITTNFKPDIVIASSTYPLDVIPAYLIAKKHKAKLIHEVHDLWPLTLKEIGGFKSWHPMILLFQWAENFSYKNSDRVVSMLPGALSYMKEHGLSEDRYCVVPNGVRVSDWDEVDNLPEKMKNYILEKKNQGFFLVGYTGGMGPANALNYFIDSMATLKNEKIFAILIGQGTEKINLEQMAKSQSVENICFFDSIPKKQIPSFLSYMDVLYIGWQKKEIYRYGTNPNKLLDYMMSSKPVIHSITASNDWVDDARCGVSVQAEDSASVSSAILKLQKLSVAERSEIGRRGRDYVEKNHQYSKLSKMFIAGLVD